MADSGSAPKYIKFLIASTSGMGATAVCYPLDVVKFRMQVSGEMGKKADHANSFQFARAIVKNEGLMGLYSGLSASLLRQATYTGTRLGVYQSMLDYFTTEDGGEPTILQKVFCGLVGGIAGGFVGVPSDVAMTRMAVDGRLPKEQRRNYTCVTNALWRIYKEEGFMALFRGTVPTITRAVIVNISQFVTYSQTKLFLIKYGITGDTTPCHIIASMMASFVSTVCMLPPDMAKTRIQNMKIIDGKPEYKGILDVWIKLITKEGILAPWKGFTPLLIRGLPMGLVLFLLIQNMKIIDGAPQYSGVINVWVKVVTTEGVSSLWKGFTPMLLRSLPKSIMLFLFYENQFRMHRDFMNAKANRRAEDSVHKEKK